jgi:hypothetical protein
MVPGRPWVVTPRDKDNGRLLDKAEGEAETGKGEAGGVHGVVMGTKRE